MAIAAKCTQLQSLNVSECEKLTDASLKEIASASRCTLTGASFAAVSEQLPVAVRDSTTRQPSVDCIMSHPANYAPCNEKGATVTEASEPVMIRFSSVRFSKRISTGRCGPVYAGTLVTNEAVAIKELTGEATGTTASKHVTST